MESTTFVARWIRDEKLETIVANEPKITSGQVIAHSAASQLRSPRTG
jgi:hypothetical protein